MEGRTMTPPSDQRLAVARLTTYCEKIAASGALSFEQELSLRALVNFTCNAFDMATVAERPSNELVEEKR